MGRSRRVVFLDIDGVVAPIRHWDRYGDLDPACIKALNEIVAQGAADVVIGATPSLRPGAIRGKEIAAWLAEHDVAGYVILDDHVDMGALRPQLVVTHPAHGLRPDDVPRAVAILTGPAITSRA